MASADVILGSRLLNVYLREVGGAAHEGKLLRVELRATGQTITAAVRRASLGGHHQLEVDDDPMRLAELLVAEIAARGSTSKEVLGEIQRSITATRVFAGERRRDGFIGAEQSIFFGHPFHPSAKACDLAWARRYRPELGARFALHWFAVHPDLVEGDADDLLDERGWPLLPCHPWQAGFLAERMPAGKVVPLGPSGEEALPTSSVRTVYLPRADRFFKLPLDVRITNFVRTNPREHVRRTLAASRLLREVEIPFGITILHETGYRAIAPLFDSSAVIFREGLRGSEPRVLAALLEPIDPPLAELVFEAAQARAVPVTPAFVCSWLSRYLELALLPVLRLFARHGISLEAHAQNTLLATEAGWPARVYIRDLEGTSVSRRRAANGADATLLVDESEALKRLRYYLVTNQIAHVVATLAAHTPADEWQLWQIVRSVVEDDPDARPLLDTPDLPAKANLVSRMAGRSETPTYVSIPNPLRTVVEP